MSSPIPETVFKEVTFRGQKIEVQIDPSDEALYNLRTWCGSSDGSESNFYIISKLYDPETQKSSTLYLHRYLMKPPTGMVIDHINGDTTDNRRSNLRIVTRAQNNANSRARRTFRGRPTSSTYKGVSRVAQTNRWRAKISRRGKAFHLGDFVSEKEAARAYDRKAYELNGEHAFLNFPEVIYQVDLQERQVA